MASKKITQKHERRAWYFHAQEGKCCRCGNAMLLDCKPTDTRFASFDHVIPRASLPKGSPGRNKGSPENVLLAHKGCNFRHGDAPAPPALLKRAAKLMQQWHDEVMT